VSRGGWRWKIEAARSFGDELGHSDRIQVKVVEQPAFVVNSCDWEFKPIGHELSNDFQGRVSLRLVFNLAGRTYFAWLFPRSRVLVRRG
jgi:hypothetical protein